MRKTMVGNRRSIEGIKDKTANISQNMALILRKKRMLSVTVN